MAIDLTGIFNENEFYTHHYLSAILENDLKELFSKWEIQKKEGVQPPYEQLRRMARDYFVFRGQLQRERKAETRLELQRDWTRKFLSVLGYQCAPCFRELDEGGVLPLLGEIVRPNGCPEIWFLEAIDMSGEDIDPLSVSLLSIQMDGNLDANKRLLDLVLDDVVTKLVFGQDEPPRWVFLLSDTQVILLDRSKWNEKRFLRFNLPDIFNRKEPSTLKAMSALLHRDSILPSDGISLLDTLDDNSHKHAFEVSEDLKYSLRQAVELLGNEVVYYLREIRKKGVYTGQEELDEKELTIECLRYMYRLLFLFFIEARPELGYLPMNADAYRAGYSLDALRDLELVNLTTEEAKNTFFIHESLQLLFDLVYNGYPRQSSKGTQEIIGQAEHHTFKIAPLRSHLFDPARTPILKRVKFRNEVLRQVIELMSLSRPKRHKGRRGRISYSQLGINQLGAVYEALLSYQGFFAKDDLYEVKKAGEQPNELDTAYFVTASHLKKYSDDEKVFNEDGTLRMYPKGSFIYRLAGRNREKSASYYTPEVLTKCLVKYALKELLKDKAADDILSLTICEPAMGSAAFLNEAINQLAEAYLERKQRETGQAISHDDYARERQKVKMYLAANNVFGVDLNPVAVELAEVSLWLNTIYEGAYVPWFGMQLVAGNSLIGARRQVFDQKHLKKGVNGDDLWLNRVPERIMPGKERANGYVYHFLLPDSGMAEYKDKVVRDMAKAEIKEISDWRKEFTKPFTDSEIEQLEKLSTAVDRLYKRHAQQQRDIRRRTSDALTVFGQTEPVPSRSPKTTEEKDKIYYQEMLSENVRNSSPFRRLKLAMDYWCSLWFWPIEKADLLPSRHEFMLELSLILEGNVIDVSGGKGEMDPLFPMTMPKQEALKLVDEFGYVDVDRLSKELPRLALVRQLSENYRFLHWELHFADIFYFQSGFDLVLGNPPWIKIEWNEGALLGDFNPLFIIRKTSAPQLSIMRQGAIETLGILQEYINEYVVFEGTQNFLNAYQNYPLLKRTQSNLYKCFLPQAWLIGTEDGISSFLHPEGVYDDPNGGILREEIYRRLIYHFQFLNVKHLFAEILHWVTYSINIYGKKKRDVSFHSISNLFMPQTIDASYEDTGNTCLDGIKDKNNNWNTVGHRDRILYIDENILRIFVDLYDDSNTPTLQARLPVAHSGQLVQVLRKFASQEKRLGDRAGEYFATVMWDEANAQKTGIIKRLTQFPDMPVTFILSGPHFYVGRPFYKTPNKLCDKHHEYSCLDLTNLPDDYLPRTNYIPACDATTYSKKIPKVYWAEKEPVTSYFRVVTSKMLSQSGERTLQGAIIPKGIGHIDSVFSISFADNLDLVFFAAAWMSLPFDFLIKTTGKSNFRHELAVQLPILSDKWRVQIVVRALILNCLTTHYRELWEECWNDEFRLERWTKSDSRLNNIRFDQLDRSWQRNTALRTDYERRQALIEIDVLVALSLGLTLDELCTIYRIQFPVLRQNENDTWYDQSGRITFTVNKGLPGIGFSRAQWENMSDMKAGIVSRTIVDDTLPSGPVERTIVYEAPFDRCDREQDYKTAWVEFERRFREQKS